MKNLTEAKKRINQWLKAAGLKEWGVVWWSGKKWDDMGWTPGKGALAALVFEEAQLYDEIYNCTKLGDEFQTMLYDLGEIGIQWEMATAWAITLYEKKSLGE